MNGLVLDTELAAVRAELSRVDSKASTLLGLAGAAAAILATALAGRHLPGPTAAAGWSAAAAARAAVVLLLLAVRPRLICDGQAVGGFPFWARHTPGQVLRKLDRPGDTGSGEFNGAELLVGLSRLTTRKYQLVRHATDLLVAAVAFTALAAVTAAIA